ncbi:hypothetical protein D4R86_04185 [bacterium]|nr:MAG: hypothetical protein D4R86_04185 [bacterium]
MTTSHRNGHKIIWNNTKRNWCYENGEVAKKDRPCPKCGRLPTKEGHDHCIANLPGVKNACCGHGITDGYIQFKNGVTIIFKLIKIQK